MRALRDTAADICRVNARNISAGFLYIIMEMSQAPLIVCSLASGKACVSSMGGGAAVCGVAGGLRCS